MTADGPIPQPGPAEISHGGGPDEWLEAAKQCKYLPEADIKRLCEIVKEYLMEGQCGQKIVGSHGTLFNVSIYTNNRIRIRTALF